MRILALLCIPIFLLLAAPARAEAPHTRQILLAGPPIWESAPLIALAQDQPVAGVTFTFRPWSTPEELRRMVMDDQPVMAVAPSPMAAILAGKGIGLRVISATTTGDSVAIIGRGATLTQLQDLQGATLALPFKGYLPDLMMRRIAAPGPDSWQAQYTGSLVAGVQLLLAGQVDAALLAEPMASLALAQDPGLSRRAGLCTLWRRATALAGCPPAGVVVVNPAFGEIGAVRAGYSQVFAALARQPDQAAGLLARYFPGMENAAQGFARIEARDLPMPDEARALADFYAAILEIEPAAVGGALPPPALYGE